MSQYYLLGRFAMRWRKMRPIVTEVAWSVCVSVCVSVGGNLASYTTAKLTEMSACRANSFAVVTPFPAGVCLHLHPVAISVQLSSTVR